MSARVSIRLGPAMLAELDRRARSCGRPRAALIRDALTVYLAQPVGASHGRPIERVRHLLGVIDGLPSDLASRRRDQR